MSWVFWISVALVVYVYAGYPLLAWLLSRLVGRPVAKEPILPWVTVLTAAHNEAAHIGATVRNKLTQDYPEDRLDVIVVSDASTDGTDEIVSSLGPRVCLLRRSERGGKTLALNEAAREARGEILVFADANSMYAPDAIRMLVQNFADPSVGYATGKMVYVQGDGSIVGDGCSAYMRYENRLRTWETRLASVVGADGGIDAVRKALYVAMRADQQPDFVLPLTVAERGYRVVYEPAAVLREDALKEQGDEYRMRVRVSLRALWALWDKRAVMNPFKHGLLAAQVISHKLLRYLAPLPLAAALVSSLWLAGTGLVYTLAASLQALFYLLAAAGAAGRLRRVPGTTFACYFALLNVAAAHALLRFVRGTRQATWRPRTG